MTGSNIDTLLRTIQNLKGAPTERIAAEIEFARRVSMQMGGKYDELLTRAAQEVVRLDREQGALTVNDVKALEEMLAPAAADCKRYTALMVGHAHIDMNWQWGYDETVQITLDTFRTMLNLMKEHPHFTYAQSQASTYKIVEQYEPEMLEEIKARIHAGQWEVTASAWVEPDRNMPSRGSEIRHLLNTRQYLSRLFDIPVESLNLDFEPDSFGHNAGLPDTLAQGGVRYLYHCRGENEQLYRWQGAGGSEILTVCEPAWYNMTIAPKVFMRLPQFCDSYHVPAELVVYGVGDHGGGPTRRDLERIEDMMTWPIFPTIRYGSYREFFALMEKARDQLPVLTGERNCVFTGCYSSQSRIKTGNAMSERLLYTGEAFSAFARLTADMPNRRASINQAWEHVLFNHFHDILPGSGVRNTREYALGLFQQANALITGVRRDAYAAISKRIDTSAYASEIPAEDMAVGAGVGYGTERGYVSPMSYGGGNTRLFHVFNALPYARDTVVEFTVWDFKESEDVICFADATGHALAHQVIKQDWNVFWGHHYTRVLVSVHVPACGYTTVILTCREHDMEIIPKRADMRLEKMFDMTLENELVHAEFDPMTAQLIRLTDKATGRVLAQNAAFELIHESAEMMTSWIVGRYKSAEACSRQCDIAKIMDGPVRQAYQVTVPVGERSLLKYIVSLDAGSRQLLYEVDCDWQELGKTKASIPHLSFAARLPEAQKSFPYCIQNGEIVRESAPQDKPALFGMAGGETALLCDVRYGYRGDKDTMRVCLVRSSADPDPYPEKGSVQCRIALGAAEDSLNRQAEKHAFQMDILSDTAHTGTLPLEKSYMTMTGDPLSVKAIKLAEDKDALVIHLCNETDAPAEAVLHLCADVASACRCDILENAGDTLPTCGNQVTAFLDAHAVGAVMISLKA